MHRVHTSRRKASLKPGDYDHEIGIVDHELRGSYEAPSPDLAGMSRISTRAHLLPSASADGMADGSDLDATTSQQDHGDASEGEHDGLPQARPSDAPHGERDEQGDQDEQYYPHPAMEPSIEVQGALKPTSIITHLLPTS
jgi:hypothetical protein